MSTKKKPSPTPRKTVAAKPRAAAPRTKPKTKKAKSNSRPGKIAFTAAAKLPPNPGRSVIKPRVIGVIHAEAVRNGASAGNLAALLAGDEHLHMETDLKINLARRKALSIDYSKISKSYQGGKAVGQLASGAADTVAKAIDLVTAKANGK